MKHNTTFFILLLIIAGAVYVASLGTGVFALGANPNKQTISASSTEHWAWNDVTGWLDFPYSGGVPAGQVFVGDLSLEGYALSGVGEVALDCATAPGADCVPQYYVLNDRGGRLSGWAWNDSVGWVSFCGTASSTQVTAGCPYASTTYQVIVDPFSGDFAGYAWNSLVGWISFNSINHGGSVAYKLNTLWRATTPSGTIESVVFDTGIPAGAQVNALVWRGKKIAGARVDFQVAVSNNSTGPWDFKGPSGTANDWFPTSPSNPIRSISADQDEYTVPITRPDYFYNKRYVKYKMLLTTPTVNYQTPRVDQVFLNWSP